MAPTKRGKKDSKRISLDFSCPQEVPFSDHTQEVSNDKKKSEIVEVVTNDMNDKTTEGDACCLHEEKSGPTLPVTPEKTFLYYVIDVSKMTYVKFDTKGLAEQFVRDAKFFVPESAESLRVSQFTSETDLAAFLDTFKKLNNYGSKTAVKNVPPE